MFAIRPLLTILALLFGAWLIFAQPYGYPVRIALELEAAAREPSLESATVFFKNHSAAVSLMFTGAVLEANQCMKDCSRTRCSLYDTHMGTCSKRDRGCMPMFDFCRPPEYGEVKSRCCSRLDYDRLILGNFSVGLAASRDWRFCMPRECSDILTRASVFVANSILLSSPHVGDKQPIYFYGPQLRICPACLLKEWSSSQVVADLVTICRVFGTYANVSDVLFLLKYTRTPGPILGIVLERHPSAARLLDIASRLRAKDLCNLFSLQ